MDQDAGSATSLDRVDGDNFVDTKVINESRRSRNFSWLWL